MPIYLYVGLFCACNRSLFPYGRPLLTLTHTHTHTSGMPLLECLFRPTLGLFCAYSRSLMTCADLRVEDNERSSNCTMMDVVHMWCAGASFAAVCAKSKVMHASVSKEAY